MSDQYGGYAPQTQHAGGYSGGAGQQSYGQQWGTSDQEGPALQQFVSVMPPDSDVTRPSEEFLSYAEGKVGPALIRLWREHGLGFYGEQRLAIVDPGDWMAVLQEWLGADVSSFPIAVTSFGHVYHYDRQGGQERVQCLDPHFQSNTVVAQDLTSFFNEHLTGGSSHISDLEGPRGGARQKLGPLAEGEIYYFMPMLALGGTVSPDSLAKGPGPEHLEQIHRAVGQSRG
ncbi:DUF1851 domain-containing protein [Luteipulveratus sp. YIM 133132]|uniref:DUF1851 domain-containing protein n=1 Tax=Luteipulveratus flavus TaxID=3031728 RepID=A0ABT6C8V1_9MICO|nr:MULTISPECIES: GAD-like domain-containing protein [unclassified Luteipulveratus]MDE9366265.1 DUF1851 domain-containing protein [Luteipulveratus sp. YIM 133132]MDF8265354.1 DUF1851 domain-containing protein [Luteipulveratus sp. YIM 133296]